AENRTQETFLRGEFGFALRSDFADENVARFNFRADSHHPIRSKIAQRFLAYVRNIACDFFGTKLGIARPDLEFVDVDGGVNILLHDLLRDHDRVFKVVAIPWHKGDEHVSTEREFSVLRIRS